MKRNINMIRIITLSMIIGFVAASCHSATIRESHSTFMKILT